MRAAVLSQYGFAIVHEEKPAFAENEILIRVIGCGVCSGDVYVYKNRRQLAATTRRLGHEGSGVVAGVGRKVTGFEMGDLVTSFALQAYADHVVARPENTVMLPAGIDPVYALGEAIACSVHAANRFAVRDGDRVAILGCGFMGLICLQLASYQGAGYVCAFDPLPERLEMSRRFGADDTLNPMEYDERAIVDQLGEFDVVIEAAGTQSVIDLSTALVTRHGRIILIGYHQSNDGFRRVNMERWNYKAIDVVNGHVRRHDQKLAAMKEGMELLSQGHLSTEPLVKTYELAEIEKSFANQLTNKESIYKAVLTMDGQRSYN